MEKKRKNTLIFSGIIVTLVLLLSINFVYADEGKCPELSNYVGHTYFIHDEMENNFVEFDISASEQVVPIYIYIDKPFVQQMFVINLTQKDNNGRYFDHVRLNLKDTTVSEIYLNRPGIHTLLITTDAHYYREDISNLCVSPYPCNALPHPCSKSDRILEHIKVISKDKDYGIIYKFTGLKNIDENISYLEKPITTGNFTEEYNWKLFLLSNSSALKLNDEHTKEVIENATETTKKFTSAVVVEGTVYDKDANPVKGAEVGVYIVGIEPNVIHIMTITDEEGKFKIYHKPAGQYIYRLPKIEAFNPNDKFNDKLYYGVVYSGLADSADMSVPPKEYPEAKEVPFPLVETFIIGLIIGGFLTLFGIGYINKIIDAIKGKKKEEHKSTH